MVLSDYMAFYSRVTRYFQWVNAMAEHTAELKELHRKYADRFPHEWRPGFVGDRAELLDGMVISMKFIDHPMELFYPDSPTLGKEDPDPANFAFYTCVCFTWNLFETYVRSNLVALLAEGLIEPKYAEELRSIRSQTEKLLFFIKSGKAFGSNPFTGSIPSVYDPHDEWIQLSYSDLDAIRELRNKFVHGIDSPKVIEATYENKEKEYFRIGNTLLFFVSELSIRIRALREGRSHQEVVDR